MDPTVIQGLIGALPGGGVAVLAVWFALRKDQQCSAVIAQLMEIAKASAVSNQQVVGALDALREAVKQGTRQ